MKKTGKAILIIAMALAGIIGIQQGLKYYLKGPARYFNAIIVMGDRAGVEAAKERYQKENSTTPDYCYKVVINRNEAYDENGNLMVENGVQLYNEQTFLVFSKSAAAGMLEDQMFRVRKDGDAMTGSIDTIPMEEIRGVDTEENIYLSSPGHVSEMNVDGNVIPLKYADYAWIGYYPESAIIVIADDAVYASVQREEMQVSLIQLEGSRNDLRNDRDKQKINTRLSGIADISIDYAYIK